MRRLTYFLLNLDAERQTYKKFPMNE